MGKEIILSLDVSSKTGWAAVESDGVNLTLIGSGVINKTQQPLGNYPHVFIEWAHTCFNPLKQLIIKYKPNILVIEETASGSKSIYSQKILEFTHFLLASYIVENNIESQYFKTGEWRAVIGASMSKEEKAHNKYVKEYKKNNKAKIAYDIKGKRIGKITKKHVNIRKANEIFGKSFKKPLQKKDEDMADALCMAYAYHLRKLEIMKNKENL